MSHHQGSNEVLHLVIYSTATWMHCINTAGPCKNCTSVITKIISSVPDKMSDRTAVLCRTFFSRCQTFFPSWWLANSICHSCFPCRTFYVYCAIINSTHTFDTSSSSSSSITFRQLTPRFSLENGFIQWKQSRYSVQLHNILERERCKEPKSVPH